MDADGLIDTDALGLIDADGLIDALLDWLGEILADGEIEADADRDTEALGDNETLGEMEDDGDSDVLALGLSDVDVDADALCEGLRLWLGLMLALGETLALADRETLALGLTDADPDNDADPLGEIEDAAPGFVTSFISRPSNLVVTTVAGNDPVTESPTQRNVRCRMLPARTADCVIVPGMQGLSRARPRTSG